MNGKAAKMLRKFNRTDRRSKRVFKWLNKHEKGVISLAHRTNVKLAHIDFLSSYLRGELD